MTFAITRGQRQSDRRLKMLDPRLSAADVKERLAERDQRIAADTRTEAERWLGDPPPYRSALAQRNSSGTRTKPRSGECPRVAGQSHHSAATTIPASRSG